MGRSSSGRSLDPDCCLPRSIANKFICTGASLSSKLTSERRKSQPPYPPLPDPRLQPLPSTGEHARYHFVATLGKAKEASPAPLGGPQVAHPSVRDVPTSQPASTPWLRYSAPRTPHSARRPDNPVHSLLFFATRRQQPRAWGPTLVEKEEADEEQSQLERAHSAAPGASWPCSEFLSSSAG